MENMEPSHNIIFQQNYDFPQLLIFKPKHQNRDTQLRGFIHSLNSQKSASLFSLPFGFFTFYYVLTFSTLHTMYFYAVNHTHSYLQFLLPHIFCSNGQWPMLSILVSLYIMNLQLHSLPLLCIPSSHSPKIMNISSVQNKAVAKVSVQLTKVPVLCGHSKKDGAQSSCNLQFSLIRENIGWQGIHGRTIQKQLCVEEQE